MDHDLFYVVKLKSLGFLMVKKLKKKMHFSVAFVVYTMEMHVNSTPIKF